MLAFLARSGTHKCLEGCIAWVQVHIKVALGSAVQGVSGLEAAMELAEYISTCTSLQLRGITAEHAEPKVCPLTLYCTVYCLAPCDSTVFRRAPSDIADCRDSAQLPDLLYVMIPHACVSGMPRMTM